MSYADQRNYEIENAALLRLRDQVVRENEELQREIERLKAENQKLRDAVIAKLLA